MSAEIIHVSSYDIHSHGYIWTVHKTSDESTNMFLDRCWYISNTKPSTIEEFNKSIIQSKKWAFQKYMNVEYK